VIGICGFVRLDGALADQTLLGPMQRALVRCGTPSHAGLADGAIAMGAAGWHASLSVDASPALYRHPASGCVVVADARLHGRDHLARDAGLTMLPRPADAQLIAHAWLRHGEDCAAQLDGDFAFAVWDPRIQALFCARDIMGVRPLYVHHAPGRLFAFASSAPALLALRGVPNELNEARVGDFLANLEGIDQRVTFHKHIERLPPAHQCVLGQARLREHRYWRLGTEPLPGMPRTDAGWADALRDTMEAVVADHLASDAQGSGLTTGSMLSGGMDSSSLVVIAASQLRDAGRPALRTFSSIDTRTDNPETRAIREIHTLPGLQPHCVDHVTTGPMAERLWRHMWLTEEPFDGIMLVLNAQYLSAADAGVTAVLDGVEGDMLLLAGNAQARMLRRGRILEAWRNAQGFVSLAGTDVPGWQYFKSAVRTALVPDTLRGLRQRGGTRPQFTLPANTLISAEFAAHIGLAGRFERMQAHNSPTPHWNRFADARETMEQPFLTVALERYRRVGAAQGVDPGHPFTDKRLQVLCSQLPDHLRMGAGQNKHLLRHIMRGRMPESVRLRSDKQHLGWPQNQALLEAHRRELGERILDHRSAISRYVNQKHLSSLEAELANPMQAPSPMEWQALFNLAQLGKLLAEHRGAVEVSTLHCVAE